ADTFLVRSVLLIALRREGRVVGMLSLDDPDQQRTFSNEQQQLACAIGQQAALAIDNARLYQQAQNERARAQRLIERAQAINQVALTVNSGEELPVVLEIATRHLVRGLSADAGIIALLEAEQLHVVSHVSKTEPSEPRETTVALDNLPICYQVAASGSPLFITADQPVESELRWFRQFGFDNIMIVPLMSGVGHKTASSTAPHCIGFAFVHFQNLHYRPRKGHVAFAQDIAAQCALAIEKAHLMADLHKTAALATERANTMEAVFQAMTEGITVLDMSGNVLVRNNAASYFLGVPVNSTNQLYSFLERYPTYTLHGQPIAKEDFPLVRALKGERIRGERFMTARSDGVQRVLEISVTQMLDHTNQQIGLVSAFRDITEQTRVEGRIRKALETMLHVAEEVSGITDIKDILRNVLERTLATLNCERGAVHLYDEERQEFTPLLSAGFTEEEEKAWLQEQHVWLQPSENQYQGFRNQILEGHATVINAEQHPRLPELLNHTMILAAPITHHNHLLGLMILDRSALQKSAPPPREFSIWDMAVIEGIAQLAGLAIEQAHLQQETMEARSSEASMREANALKDEFLAITAHEFRTPLTVILAHSQMALRVLRKPVDQDTSQRLNDSLSTIEEQAHQLTNIVNTFLEVAQINRGQLVLKLAPVDLTDIIKQVVTNQSATSPEHTITFEIAPEARPYMVMGDSARLSQVLGNLIQNAIKYSPFGGPITISLRQHGGEPGRTIEVQVADKGIGIPKEAQARLFERFYRAPNIDGSKTKGVGLGLYIVSALLKMHGGSIRAESSGIYGEGSRFIITLPALESETVERE
ncbi:MAG TPA: ATP-binding protein, partial [Ktedonobacteraceae bacterium]|nr:ATP-binding protein [Ktedonobacteraceae bacterium]